MSDRRLTYRITDGTLAFYKSLRDEFAPGAPIWLTETADAACGGNPWGSWFLDTFRYLDQAGRLAPGDGRDRRAALPAGPPDRHRPAAQVCHAHVNPSSSSGTSIAGRPYDRSFRVRFDVMRFPSYAFDPLTGVATFDYVLDGPEPLSFTETITFPTSGSPIDCTLPTDTPEIRTAELTLTLPASLNWILQNLPLSATTERPLSHEVPTMNSAIAMITSVPTVTSRL